MKRWTITMAAMVVAFALIATPALAADQSRAQDRTRDRIQDTTCADCPAECDQTQTRLRDQTRTRTQECDVAQAQAGDQAQTLSRAQAGEQDQSQSQAQTMSQVQANTQTALQSGERNQENTPTWAQKIARHKAHDARHYAKRAHTIVSSN